MQATPPFRIASHEETPSLDDDHEGKMFQTCGSAILSQSGRTINAREGSDDHPSAALPLLPRKRYCQAWAVA
jgi:hypothetical protein